jgi:hypothetical protein
MLTNNSTSKIIEIDDTNGPWKAKVSQNKLGCYSYPVI